VTETDTRTRDRRTYATALANPLDCECRVETYPGAQVQWRGRWGRSAEASQY